ncbi:MAG: 50S ribosomal protein L5 [Patescibacteria group bacterium]
MKLKELYQKEVLPSLKKEFGYKNILAVPQIKKATINVGLSRNFKDKEFVEEVQKNLEQIAGQKPVLTKARKSVSSFKIRAGMFIGVKVTLRGSKMYDLVDRLIHVVFPRVRDFRGISEKCVDTNGNLSIGFNDVLAFPELEVQNIKHPHGLEICISTTAKTKEEGVELFRKLGFPFKESMGEKGPQTKKK